MEARSVLQFLQWHSENDSAAMFRGQLDSGWSLVPSIVRYSNLISDGYDAIEHIEEHLIEQFEQFSVPFGDYRKHTYIEKLIHAQHFGLPTRLLDWSTNPLKALYFSVDNPANDNADGVVFALEPAGWWEGTKQVKLDQDLAAFYPETINERVVAQEGAFISFPLPDKGFVVPELTEANYQKDIVFISSVIIPASSKKDIRIQLSRLGVNQRSIYPGLEGVARWVKSNLSHFIV
ncbi:FRG domain-containing protein [Candidatus Electrothrix aarhusensis]|uniref:FRG domain-containing protein n=1 Tax=Candidatus Electrothrix aarhusensis TaxID=1859131 RepID=A0A444IV70_9BACT|nr:FRG domain-containing protein [Candidatus Electrothrix aarhusensis]